MAKAFNLTAQINFQSAAGGIKPIIADVRRQLSGLSANITLKIDTKATKSLDLVKTKVEALNATLIQTRSHLDAVGASLRDLNSAAGSSAVAKSGSNITKVSSAAQVASKSIKQAANSMEDFGQKSALAVKRFAAFSIVTGVIYAFTGAITKGLQAFIAFDSEMIKLQQVTGQGAVGISSLEKEITRLATNLGVSSDALARVATTLAQAGLSANDTRIALSALAKTDLAPSFDDMTQTTEGAIAAMRQFDIAAKDLEGALGSINAVAQAFAVEASDIIAAIQRTGGVFAAASRGVSEGTQALQEFVAVFTSVRATTRESAETIATGLRTIFTRLQRGSTIDALRQFGVELTDLEGKFVGPYEAVKRLSEGLRTLDPRDLRFSQIVEELGGFRQIGKVIPLIEQFSTAQDALKVAQRGQSSLTDAQVIAQKSLANQLSKTREQFLALIREVGKSAAFQSLFKIVNGVAGALLSLASAFKPILPVLAILGAVKGISALKDFGVGFGGALSKGGGAKGVGSNMGSSLTGNTDRDRTDAMSKASAVISENTTALKTLTSAVGVLTNVINNRVGGPSPATLNAGGAVVRRFARGGVVPGSGRGDTVPAMLEPGEFVIRKDAVDTLGASNLHKMNKSKGGNIRVGGYASGGRMQKFRGGGISRIQNKGARDGDSWHVSYEPSAKPIDITTRGAGYDAYEIGEGEQWEQALGHIATGIAAEAFPKDDKLSSTSDLFTRLSGKFSSAGNRPVHSVPEETKNKMINLGVAKSATTKNTATKYGAVDPTQTQVETLRENNKNKEADQAQKLVDKGWEVNPDIKSAMGGKIQKFMAGGRVDRKVGYIDSDVLRDPANQAVVGPAMKALKLTDVNAYKTYLSKLAASSRAEGSLSKLRTIAGMPGAGKSSLMLGGSQSAVSDNAKLRRTTRFPILKPEDIRSASEVIDTTATVTPDKLDDYLKAADKIYMLSTSTKEEQTELKRRRESRDTTGVNLFGRKPGATSGAEIDSGPMEAMIGSDIDAKTLRTLGINRDSKLKRKENIEVQKKKIGLLYGSLSPSTVGHESLREAAETMGVPLEDFLVLIANDEGITSSDSHSLRTAIFDQDFRMLAAQAAFKGSMVSKKSNRGFVLPDVMEIEQGAAGQRRFVRPETKDSLAMMVADEGKSLKIYTDKGYQTQQMPRKGGVSGTGAREAILGGNLADMQKILSPDVLSLVMQNLPQLRNRSSILPRIVENAQQRQAYSLIDIDKELAALPQRIDSKKAASDPEYAALAAQVKDLRSRRDKIKTRASFEPFSILRHLADRYPEIYGLKANTLDESVKASVIAKEGVLSSKRKPTNLGGVPPRSVAPKPPKPTLPAKAAEISKMLQGSRMPEDLQFGEFSGVDITDGMVRQTWRAGYDNRMSEDKAASYVAVRDYFLKRFNANKEIKTAQSNNRKSAATQVGLVGLQPFGHNETRGPFDINGNDVMLHERGLDLKHEPAVRAMQARAAENVHSFATDLQKTATTGKNPIQSSPIKSGLSPSVAMATGQANVEGAIIEQVMALFGATIPEDSKANRAIDYPQGLGAGASYFSGIGSDWPTEVKRTINSDSRSTAIDEFTRYLFPQQVTAAKKMAMGGKASAGQKLGQEVYGLIEKSGLKNETSSIVQFANSAGYNLEEFKKDLAKRVAEKNSKAGIKTDPKALAELLKEPSFKTSTPAQLALAAQLKGPSDAAYTPTPSPAENMVSVNRAIRGYAVGGAASDTVPAMLTPGEFVINKKAAQSIGYNKLEKMNHADKVKGFARGGAVGGVQMFGVGRTVLKENAKAEGMSVEEYIRKLAADAVAKAGSDVKAAKQNQKGLKLDMLKGVSQIGGRKAGVVAKDGAGEYKDKDAGAAFDKTVAAFQARLESAGVTSIEAAKHAQGMGMALLESENELENYIAANETVNNVVKETASATKMLEKALNETAKSEGLSRGDLDTELGSRVKQEEFKASKTGQNLGRFADQAPDLARRFSETGVGQKLNSATDVAINGKGITEGLTKQFGFVGTALGDTIKAVGGPMNAFAIALGAAGKTLEHFTSQTDSAAVAAVAGGVTGAAGGMLTGATLGGQIAGPMGALVGGVSGALIGAINGAADAFNTKVLEQNLKALATTTGDVDSALKKLANDSSEFNVNRAKDAVLANSKSIDTLRSQSDLGQGGFGKSALDFGRMIDFTGITASVTGMKAETEARKAVIAAIAAEINSYEALGAARLKTVKTEDIAQAVEVSTTANKAILEKDKALETATGPDKERLQAEKKALQKQKTQDLYQTSQSFQVQKSISGKSEKDILIDRAGAELSDKGQGEQFTKQARTEKGREELMQRGKELYAIEAEAANRTALLTRATRDLVAATDSLLDKYRKIQAGLERFGNEVDDVKNSAYNATAALKGQAQITPTSRQGEQVLKNVSGYSKDEVQKVADQAGTLAGGGTVGKEITGGVMAAKTIKDVLPDILRNSTGKEVGGVGDPGTIMGELNQAFKDVGQELPAVLATELEANLKGKLEEGRQGMGSGELADEMNILDTITKTTSAALETATIYITKFNDAFAAVIELTGEFSKALSEASELQRKSASIRSQGDLSLAKVLNVKGPSLGDLNKSSDDRTRSMTSGVIVGGSTDANSISAGIAQKRLEQDQGNQKLESLKLGPQGPGTQAAILDQIKLLDEQNRSINDANKALEELSTDGSKAANALQMIEDRQKTAGNSVNFMEKVLTSDATELNDMNKQLGAYTKMISGKATASDTGSLKFRQEAFGGLKQVQSLMPPAIAAQMQAKMSRQMLESTPEGKAMLDTTTGALDSQGKPMTLRNALDIQETGKDPQQQAYIDAYKSATDNQANAADRLADAAVQVAVIFEKKMVEILEKIYTGLPEIAKSAQAEVDKSKKKKEDAAAAAKADRDAKAQQPLVLGGPGDAEPPSKYDRKVGAGVGLAGLALGGTVAAGATYGAVKVGGAMLGGGSAAERMAAMVDTAQKGGNVLGDVVPEGGPAKNMLQRAKAMGKPVVDKVSGALNKIPGVKQAGEMVASAAKSVKELTKPITTAVQAAAGSALDKGRNLVQGGKNLLQGGYQAVTKAPGVAKTALQAGGKLAQGGLQVGSKLLGKALPFLAPVIGGLTGAMTDTAETRAANDGQGRGVVEKTVLGALTGGAETGSFLSSTLGVKKGGIDDEALGVAGAMGTGALAGAAIGSVVPVVGTAIGAAVGAVLGGGAEIYKLLTKGDSPLVAWASSLGQGMMDAVSSGVQMFGSMAASIGSTLYDGLSSGLTSLGSIAASAGSMIKDGFGTVFGYLNEGVKSAYSWLASWFKKKKQPVPKDIAAGAGAAEANTQAQTVKTADKKPVGGGQFSVPPEKTRRQRAQAQEMIPAMDQPQIDIQPPENMFEPEPLDTRRLVEAQNLAAPVIRNGPAFNNNAPAQAKVPRLSELSKEPPKRSGKKNITYSEEPANASTTLEAQRLEEATRNLKQPSKPGGGDFIQPTPSLPAPPAPGTTPRPGYYPKGYPQSTAPSSPVPSPLDSLNTRAFTPEEEASYAKLQQRDGVKNSLQIQNTPQPIATLSPVVPETTRQIQQTETASYQQPGTSQQTAPMDNGTGYNLTIDDSSRKFLDELKSTFTSFGSYIDKLATIKIPDNITMTGTHTVDVRISGAAAFDGLKKDFTNMMQVEISKSMSKLWKQSNGGVGEPENKKA